MKKMMKSAGMLLFSLCMFPIRVLGYDMFYSDFDTDTINSVADQEGNILRENIILGLFIVLVGLGTYFINKKIKKYNLEKKEDDMIPKVSYLIFIAIVFLTIAINFVSFSYDLNLDYFDNNLIFVVFPFVVVMCAFSLFMVWLAIVVNRNSKVENKRGDFNFWVTFLAIVVSYFSFGLYTIFGNEVINYWHDYEIEFGVVLCTISLLLFIISGLTYWINKEYKEFKMNYAISILFICEIVIAVVANLIFGSFMLYVYDLMEYLTFFSSLLLIGWSAYLMKKLRDVNKIWGSIFKISVVIMLVFFIGLILLAL